MSKIELKNRAPATTLIDATSSNETLYFARAPTWKKSKSISKKSLSCNEKGIYTREKLIKKKKNALILYWSKTGNTEKVANVIKKGLEEMSIEVLVKRPEEAENVDYFDYELVCIGAPSYSWQPPEPMTNFLKRKFTTYRQQGKIKLSAPKVPGRNALIFVTYSGPHTGIDEAIPVGKYIRQFFEHLGFNVLDEWYILSEFHGSLENSVKGKMGDIRGKPTSEDLEKVRENTKRVANLL